jgi:hypothetical protein
MLINQIRSLINCKKLLNNIKFNKKIESKNILIKVKIKFI